MNRDRDDMRRERKGSPDRIRRSPERAPRDRDRSKRSRSRSRDRERRDRDKDERRDREKDRRKRSRSRSRERRRSADRRTDERNGKDKKVSAPIVVETVDVDFNAGVSEAELQMMRDMGMPVDFDSTAGKHIEDAAVNAGAVKTETKRSARQYMNRKGGFNRPLPTEVTGKKVVRD